MDLQITLINWKIEKTAESDKITGEYAIKSGTTIIAKQTFNSEYSDIKLPFPPELINDVIKLTTRIKEEITNHFLGKDN